MKKIAFLFFLFLEINLNAQVAGYMGKRFSVGYENYFFIAFAGPTVSHSNRTTPTVINLLGINNVHCLNLDYVVKSKISICLSFQHFKTGVDYRIHNHYDRAYYIGDLKKPAILTSNNIGFGFKIFKKHYVAPVGKYMKFELLLLFYDLKYNNEQFQIQDYQNSTTENVSRGNGKYSFSNFSTACSYGKQRVLSNKFILDYGIRMACKPGMFILTWQDNRDERNKTRDTFNCDAQYRILRQQCFNLYLGISFLAF